MNNGIFFSTDPNNPPTLEPLTSTGSQSFDYQYKSSDLASFLQLNVYASTTDGLLGLFAYNNNQASGSYNMFSIKNTQLTFHTSLYADD